RVVDALGDIDQAARLPDAGLDGDGLDQVAGRLRELRIRVAERELYGCDAEAVLAVGRRVVRDLLAGGVPEQRLLGAARATVLQGVAELDLDDDWRRDVEVLRRDRLGAGEQIVDQD